MKYLLEDLAAGHQAVAFTGQAFDRALRVDFVAIVVPDYVHRDVCVNEDHTSSAPASPASISAKRPASVSASIVSMSGAGKR